MNLVIDVGNARVKVALFKGNSIAWHDSFNKPELILELKEISQKNKINQAIISSVAIITENQLFEIEQLFPLIRLNHQTKIPFQNNYKTPKTLGIDRIALIAAAINQYPNQNILVIDAGTCITFDLINDKGIYSGGAISPGIEMRYKALHKYTDKLPLLEREDNETLIGNSTENSIHSGVINGVVNEINGIIERYKLEYKKLTTILTGGDTYFLAKRLKNGIFANPNFLLEGLNSILIYNSKND